MYNLLLHRCTSTPDHSKKLKSKELPTISKSVQKKKSFFNTIRRQQDVFKCPVLAGQRTPGKQTIYYAERCRISEGSIWCQGWAVSKLRKLQPNVPGPLPVLPLLMLRNKVGVVIFQGNFSLGHFVHSVTTDLYLLSHCGHLGAATL